MKSTSLLLTAFILSISSAHSSYSNDLEEQRRQAILRLESGADMQDIEFAVKVGSGEPLAINLNATEGLEGEIAQEVRKSFAEEKPKSLTFMQWIMSFFS